MIYLLTTFVYFAFHRSPHFVFLFFFFIVSVMKDVTICLNFCQSFGAKNVFSWRFSSFFFFFSFHLFILLLDSLFFHFSFGFSHMNSFYPPENDRFSFSSNIRNKLLRWTSPKRTWWKQVIKKSLFESTTLSSVVDQKSLLIFIKPKKKNSR